MMYPHEEQNRNADSALHLAPRSGERSARLRVGRGMRGFEKRTPLSPLRGARAINPLGSRLSSRSMVAAQSRLRLAAIVRPTLSARRASGGR